MHSAMHSYADPGGLTLPKGDFRPPGLLVESLSWVLAYRMGVSMMHTYTGGYA